MSILQNNNNVILNFCLCLFIATFPFELIFAPISFAILATASLICSKQIKFIHRFKANKIALLLIAFYLIHILGLFYSVNPIISYNRINTQLFILFIPLIFITLNLNNKQIQKIKTVFILSWVIFCIISFISLLYNLIFNYDHRLDYNFVQTSMYNFHFPYDVLYINAAYILLYFTKKLTSYRLIIGFLFFLFIVLSGVRMGMFLFSLLTLIFIGLNIKKLLNIRALILTVFVVFVGLLLIRNSRYVNDKFFDSLNRIGFSTEKYVSEIGAEYHKLSLRQKLWSSSIEVLKSSPSLIFGYGPQGSREILDQTYLERGYYNIQGMNSHNQYLTTLLNNGVIGILVLFLIFTISLYNNFKIKSFQNVLLIFLTIAAFTTESMLERQKGVIFFAFFFTLISLDNDLKKSANDIQ